MNTLINVEGDVLESKHISYYVETTDSDILLKEVVSNKYIHPGSDGMAYIHVIETRTIERVKRAIYTTENYPDWMNMHIAENILRVAQTKR